jgi:hypothetical protein
MTEPHTAFDTIESAQDFVRVLGETIAEARQEIERDLEQELQLPASRRTRALQIAAYNLDRLEKQMIRSRRILNDLRSLRRLLFEERQFRHVRSLGQDAAVTETANAIPAVVAAIPAPRSMGPAAFVTPASSPRRAIPA